MFTNVLQKRARSALSLALGALFFVGSISMFQMSHTDGGMSLPGCPLMAHMHDHNGERFCPMNLITHFANLTAMFTITISVVSTFALLLLIAFGSITRFRLFLKHILAPPDKVNMQIVALIRLFAPIQNLALQEAFSQGILHSKAY